MNRILCLSASIFLLGAGAARAAEPDCVECHKKESPALGKKWKAKIEALIAQDEHVWLKGLSPQEAEQLRKAYQSRYNQ